MCLVPVSYCKHQDSFPLTLDPVLHIKADVPSMYPCKLPSVHCLPLLQVFSDTPKLACKWDADAMVFTVLPKCYTIITLHHLFHIGMCVWFCNVGWMMGMPGPRCCSYPLQTSWTSQTLLYAADSCHHTHASFKDECPLVLHLPHT
jgi:hypothetical protein